jgi:hypothetical protein
LQGLPPKAIKAILRGCGPVARRLSRFCRDAYGPLDGSITLDGIHTKQQLEALLAPCPTRFHHATSLQLAIQEDTPPISLHPDFIRALAAAFPQLQSLIFPDKLEAAGSDLSVLAPLTSCLTEVVLPNFEDCSLAAAAVSLRSFTSLAELAFDLGLVSDVVEGLQELSRLPSLQSLTMTDAEGHDESCFEHDCVCCAAHWLTCLHSLSLTSLAVHVYLHGWDNAAIQALATALPQLKALTLHPDFTRRCQTQSVDVSARQPVLDALASRTGLQALHISVKSIGAGADLRKFSNLLKLEELHVVADNGEDEYHRPGNPEAQQLEQLLEAMAVHHTLTNLAVERQRWEHIPMKVSEQGLRNLLSLADGLEVLELAAWLPHSFISGLTTTTRLRELKFTNVQFEYITSDGWHDPDMSWPGLTRLANLQVLEVKDDQKDIGKAFLQHASCLTALKQLSLHLGTEDIYNEHDEEMLHDSDLLQLSCLRKTLTRLTLDEIDVEHASGPGLAVVSSLACLQRLALNHLQGSMYRRLNKYILPLPASLRRLHLEHRLGKVKLPASLLAAAAAQDCAVRVGVWS